MYLAPQIIPSATVLTLGNKVVLYCIIILNCITETMRKTCTGGVAQLVQRRSERPSTICGHRFDSLVWQGHRFDSLVWQGHRFDSLVWQGFLFLFLPGSTFECRLSILRYSYCSLLAIACINVYAHAKNPKH